MARLSSLTSFSGESGMEVDFFVWKSRVCVLRDETILSIVIVQTCLPVESLTVQDCRLEPRLTWDNER